MGSCVFQCDVPHQWIAQRATGLPRVCILWWGGVLCLVSASWHSCVECHCCKQAPWWYDLMFKSSVKPKQTNKHIPCDICIKNGGSLLLGGTGTGTFYGAWEKISLYQWISSKWLSWNSGLCFLLPLSFHLCKYFFAEKCWMSIKEMVFQLFVQETIIMTLKLPLSWPRMIR